MRTASGMLLLIAAAALAPARVFGAPYALDLGGVRCLRAADAAALCGLSPVRGSGNLEYSGGGARLKLTPRKLPIQFGGIRIYQCFPTQLRGGIPYLSRLDFEKTLLPLSSRRSGVLRRQVRSITLDCGHGGRDKGASGAFSHEKDISLRIGRRVAEILRACGYRVGLTRDRDLFVPLAERGAIQRRARSDLFVSIHVNAARDRALAGVETYALTPAGAASSSGGKPLKTAFSGNSFDANNILLAASIQRALLRRTGAVDRGVKRARFAVLRDLAAPGVLIELGFISNPREERLLNDPAYREKLARGIVEGIIAYHRLATR